jgi:hypothetical protein
VHEKSASLSRTPPFKQSSKANRNEIYEEDENENENDDDEDEENIRSYRESSSRVIKI